MPTTHIAFTETDLQELVRNDVRARHKLKKDHDVKTLVVIDRDEEGENPTVSIETSFEEEVVSKSGTSKK